MILIKPGSSIWLQLANWGNGTRKRENSIALIGNDGASPFRKLHLRQRYKEGIHLGHLERSKLLMGNCSLATSHTWGHAPSASLNLLTSFTHLQSRDEEARPDPLLEPGKRALWCVAGHREAEAADNP